MSAFDKGEPVVISVFNQAKTPLTVDLAALVAALQVYVDKHVAPVWNTPCTLKLTSGPVPGTWGLIFLDDADSPGALAYHDEESGMPVSKVFLATIANAGDSVSSAASHELVEMLVDPGINLQCVGPNGATVYPYEAADPVESNTFPIPGTGLQMSNFVYPSWFEGFRGAGSTQFDHMGILHAPFQLATGGYASVFAGGRWSNIYGSEAKMMSFKYEDRRGHRSEYRKSHVKSWSWWRRLLYRVAPHRR